MFSVCELLEDLDDWAEISGNTTLAEFVDKTHETWHLRKDKVMKASFAENSQNIAALCASICRTIDIWINGVY